MGQTSIRKWEYEMSLWVLNLNDNEGTQMWMTVISFSVIFLIIGVWVGFKIWELIKNREE